MGWRMVKLTETFVVVSHTLQAIKIHEAIHKTALAQAVKGSVQVVIHVCLQWKQIIYEVGSDENEHRKEA